MQLVVLGLNHRSAAVEVRERFSFDKDEVVAALNRLYEFDCISECVILSTCNRTEIYAALEGPIFKLIAQAVRAQYLIFYSNVLLGLVKRCVPIRALQIRLYPLVTPLLT